MSMYGRGFYKFKQMTGTIKIKKRDNPEGRLVLDIIKYLRAKGYTVGKVKVKGGIGKHGFIRDPYTFRGVADLLCFTRDKIGFIEVKAPNGGKQSDWQKCFQECCDRCGVMYILARSVEDCYGI